MPFAELLRHLFENSVHKYMRIYMLYLYRSTYLALSAGVANVGIASKPIFVLWIPIHETDAPFSLSALGLFLKMLLMFWRRDTPRKIVVDTFS